MYIPTPKSAFLNKEVAVQELQELIEQPGPGELRPCPNCPLSYIAQLPSCCNAACRHIPFAMSNEPEHHPIEPRVARIVFELATLRLVQPCWSCEGHYNGRGELWKLPQVSFYAASPLYPKLLADYLIKLKGNKPLSYPWQVSLVNFGQTWGPTYQMEPALNQGMVDIRLERLQEDLGNISDCLAERLKQEARLMLTNIRQWKA